MKSVAVRKKAPFVILLSVALVLALAGVAYASGYFTWNATFYHAINTRTYSTPNPGGHSQYSYVNYAKSGVYTSALYHEHWYGDERLGIGYFHPGVTNAQQYWAPSGGYHWTVSKTTLDVGFCRAITVPSSIRRPKSSFLRGGGATCRPPNRANGGLYDRMPRVGQGLR
jgi:NADH:ubiquinone oxidoreductase subunit 5 (subunit L)/multisubunit Na+/H+ antiporter MnhA subunit